MLVAAGLAYGSLYPWVFSVPANGVGPLQTLLRTAASAPQLGDFLVNIVLYLPLGFFGVRAMPSRMPVSLQFMLTLLVGVILSTGCEILQYYDQGRVSSTGDIYTNAGGTALGAVCGLLFRHDFRTPLMQDLQLRPFPALLIVSWLGDRLYPYIPTTNFHKYLEALRPLLQPQFTVYNSLRYTVMWLTVGALLEAVWGEKRSRWLLPPLAACVMAAKMVLMGHAISADEIAGIAAGFAIWLVLVDRPVRRRALFAILPLLLFVLAWRLQPFAFGAAEHSFGWLPFRSLFYGSVGVNTQNYFVKVFYYGSLIWFAAEAGLPMWLAGLVVAAFLLGLSGAEMFLPGRSAEVTDASMAVIIAFLASVLASPKRDFIVEGYSRRV